MIFSGSVPPVPVLGPVPPVRFRSVPVLGSRFGLAPSCLMATLRVQSGPKQRVYHFWEEYSWTAILGHVVFYFLGFRGVLRFSISMIFVCVFLIVPGALGPLPSDRTHREDSDGMENVFWDALGPEL